MRARFIFLLWLIAVTAPLRGGEIGRPFMQSFAARDYHAFNQTMAATQDARGLLYFGNRGLVLEYDGVSWRQLPIGATTFVRGLATDPATDTLYVGGVNELGLLPLAADGSRAFVSLRDRLAPGDRDFRDIWQTHATPDGIFFVASQQVMRWRDGRFTVWKLPNPDLIRSFVINGRLYVQPTGQGLLRLDGETFRPVSSDALFQRATVRALLPTENAGNLLVATQDDGFYVLDPATGHAAPFPTRADAWLRAQGINGVVRTADGSLAVGTRRAGLVLLAPDGTVLGRLDESTGLAHDFVYTLFVDRDRSLWLCLNAGLCHVETPSAFSIFDAGSGLKRASVYDEGRVHGKLLIATSVGVYRLADATPSNAAPDAPPALPRFEPVPGLGGRFSTILVHARGGLLTSGEPGVFQGGDGDAPPVRLSSRPALLLQGSRADPDRVFTGNYDGELRALHVNADGGWTDEGRIVKVDDEIRSMAETARGDLWLGTPQRGAVRVRLRPGGGPPTVASVTAFLGTHGLPAGQGWTRVDAWDGAGILLTTQAGLYRFDEETEAFRPASEYGARLTDGSFRLNNSAPDAAGNLWLAGRTSGVGMNQEVGRAIPARNGAPPRWQPLPSRVVDKVGEAQGMFAEDDGHGGGVVWIGGTDGIVRVDVTRWLADQDAARPFATWLRRVPFVGTRNVLPYTRNSLGFEFASDLFTVGSVPRFQTRLAGFGNGAWSDPGERASVNYTNLPEGGYVFHVRAMDADGRPGREAAVAFRILPPWQRTPWAYAAYAGLAALGVYGIVRARVAQLHRQTVALENLVATRTAELVRARDAADAASRAKGTFLAHMSHELRTPLNSILGYTHLLLADGELPARHRDRLMGVERSGSHLLAMINEVLDLSKIEAGKLTLNVTECALGPLLDDVCMVFRARAAEGGLEFGDTRAPGLPGSVRADAGKLRQVLFNLLANAVKFTPRGRVDLRVEPAGPGRVRFEVADTGVGIPAEELEAVFLAFHQTGAAELATQGTGLGLTISRRLVEGLGGTLHVESEPGRGSRFWFEAALVETGAEVAPVLAETHVRVSLPADVPPVEEIDALLALSQRGDILAIRRRLAELQDVNGGCYRAFVAGLAPLAAAYRMRDLTESLFAHREKADLNYEK